MSTQSRDSRQHATYNDSMSWDIADGRESMDIALIPAAAAIDRAEPPVSTPTYTDVEISTWREQEKAGKLSNGLGVGLKPPMTIREVELLLTGPVDDQLLSPTMLFYRKSFLSRAATRKHLHRARQIEPAKPLRSFLTTRNLTTMRTRVSAITPAPTKWLETRLWPRSQPS